MLQSHVSKHLAPLSLLPALACTCRTCPYSIVPSSQEGQMWYADESLNPERVWRVRRRPSGTKVESGGLRVACGDCKKKAGGEG